MNVKTAVNTVVEVAAKAYVVREKALRILAENPGITGRAISGLEKLQQYANDHTNNQNYSPESNRSSNGKTPIVEVSFDKNQAA